MRPLRKKINFTIDSDIIEIIREEAEQDDRSLSQYINIILKEHIKEKAKWNYQVKLKKPPSDEGAFFYAFIILLSGKKLYINTNIGTATTFWNTRSL